MKKLVFGVFVAFLLSFQSVYAIEQIESFDVSLELLATGELKVEETIIYNFGTDMRHGIYRDIARESYLEDQLYRLDIEELSAANSFDVSYMYDVTESRDRASIKIGDPDKFISGVHTYRIKYSVPAVVLPGESSDTLRWNVTGNNWNVPIVSSETLVMVDNALHFDCYRGEVASSDSCADISSDSLGVNFVSGSLGSGEGYTIEIEIPKGRVATYIAPVSKLILDYIPWYLLPLLVFIFLLSHWHKKGRDPKGKGTIIHQYDPPDNLSPAEVGTLYDESVHSRDVIAATIELARNGYFTIERVYKDNFFGKHFKAKDFKLVKTDKFWKTNKGYDRKLLDYLFSLGSEVYLSDLKNSPRESLNNSIKQVHDGIYRELVKQKYFANHPYKIKATYLTIGGVLIVGGVYLGFLGSIAIGLVLSGILISIFAFVMPKRTKKGVFARDHIEGFKTYLEVAESDRIAFHQSPDSVEKKAVDGSHRLNPDRFERLLPYAVALGVEKKWAGAFEGLNVVKPKWYHDSTSNSAWNVIDFTNGVSGFSSAFSTQTAYASGHSGGGFSGGGFGGGGGGSW